MFNVGGSRVLPCIVVLLGCSAGTGRSDAFGGASSMSGGDGVDTDPLTTSISASSGLDGSSGGGSGEAEGPALDVHDPGTASGAGSGDGTPQCTKIDLLFVIDGSISMDVAQDKLQASLGSFVAAIENSIVGQTDFHLGVVTTTAYPHNVDGCTAPGSLVVQTGGEGSSATTCGPFTGDAHHLTAADDPIADNFRCIAQIGLGNGNVELTAQAILAAVDGDGPDGCNVGFARTDALLVVVDITDTDDPSAYPPGAGSAGGPTEWFEALVALRGGVETNIVMISIIPPTTPSCTVEGNWSPLLPGPLDAPRITEFTQMFTNHYIGDICAADYGVLLGEALATIETGCDDYTPVG
jgi:hypothetical protein